MILNSVIHIEELDDLLIEGAVAETTVATNGIKLLITIKCKVSLPGFNSNLRTDQSEECT